MSELNEQPCLPFAKLLLEQRSAVWLFKITEGMSETYSVERGNRCWEFGQLSEARAKFELEVLRQPIGGRS
jgi:hypothetical protein